jgi:hypothetical protein
MIALDGNAIAGDLLEVFGVDLAAAMCVCAACGMSSVVAEGCAAQGGSRAAAGVASCSSCS